MTSVTDIIVGHCEVESMELEGEAEICPTFSSGDEQETESSRTIKKFYGDHFRK